MPDIHAVLLALGRFLLATIAAAATLVGAGSGWDQAAVVLPTLLAVVAAIMTTFPLESRTSKIGWRIGLIVFGIITSGVTLEQQKFTRQEATTQAADYYRPAGILVYEGERLTFYNKSKSTLYLWGDKLDGGSQDIESEPRILPIDSTYYFLADRMNRYFLDEIGNNGEQMIPFEIYFKNEEGKKYTSRFILLVTIKDGKIAVHTQMLSFDQQEWP